MLEEVGDIPVPRPTQPDPEAVDPAHARRRIVWASASGIALSCLAFAWMVTGGTFRFFQSVPFSNFYDVQARSLLSGKWSVPPSVLSIEGIRTGGHTFMYYGPIPALLRIPVLIWTHRFDGRLTAPSLLIAFMVGLIVSARLSWRIRRLVRGPVAVSGMEMVLTAGLMMIIGLGTVLFFLGSTIQVYEEAELWGAVLSLGALDALVGFLVRPNAKSVVTTGIMATLAMLTRGSVGAGPLVAIGCVAAVYLLAWSASGKPKWDATVHRIAHAAGIRITTAPAWFGAGLLGAMGVPLALFVTINEIKFGTLFSIPLNRQVLTFESAHRRAVLAANGGSLFGLKFLPTNLFQFLRPDALAVVHSFPWIFFPGKALVIGHALYSTRDWTSSIPASMPVIFLLSLLGIVLVFRRSHDGRQAASIMTVQGESRASIPPPAPAEPSAPAVGVLRIPLLGSAAGTGGILIIGFIAERYLADAMPFLILAALPGWHAVMERGLGAKRSRTPRGVRRLVGTLLVILAVFELWTTFSLSLFYQREVGPVVTIPQRAGMVAFQEDVHRSLGGPAPHVRFVTKLPSAAAPLTLAVVGSCAAVYQFDGNQWHPVEVGRGGGGLLLDVTFPRNNLGRRQPLVVTGGATPQDVVAVTWEGGDLYRFSYFFAASNFLGIGRRWYTEAPVAVTPGPHEVQLDLITGIGQVYLTVGGSPAFSLLYPVAAPTSVQLGTAPPGIATIPRFTGSIRSLPVPTPICNQLEQRR